MGRESVLPGLELGDKIARKAGPQCATPGHPDSSHATDWTFWNKGQSWCWCRRTQSCKTDGAPEQSKHTDSRVLELSAAAGTCACKIWGGGLANHCWPPVIRVGPWNRAALGIRCPWWERKNDRGAEGSPGLAPNAGIWQQLPEQLPPTHWPHWNAEAELPSECRSETRVVCVSIYLQMLSTSLAYSEHKSATGYCNH